MRAAFSSTRKRTSGPPVSATTPLTTSFSTARRRGLPPSVRLATHCGNPICAEGATLIVLLAGSTDPLHCGPLQGRYTGPRGALLLRRMAIVHRTCRGCYTFAAEWDTSGGCRRDPRGEQAMGWRSYPACTRAAGEDSASGMVGIGESDGAK